MMGRHDSFSWMYYRLYTTTTTTTTTQQQQKQQQQQQHIINSNWYDIVLPLFDLHTRWDQGNHKPRYTNFGHTLCE